MNQKLLCFFFGALTTSYAFTMTLSSNNKQKFISQQTHSLVYDDLNHSSNIEEAERIIGLAIQDLSNQTGIHPKLICNALLAEISAEEIRAKTAQELEQLIIEIRQGGLLRAPRIFRSPSGPLDNYAQILVILAGYLGLMY